MHAWLYRNKWTGNRDIRKQADNAFHDSIEKVNYGLSHGSVVY